MGRICKKQDIIIKLVNWIIRPTLIFLLCYRNPEALSRPSFCAIIIALQHPDREILKWSEKDKAVSSKRAMTLGAPIEEGANLFKDLQHTYMQKPVV